MLSKRSENYGNNYHHDKISLNRSKRNHLIHSLFLREEDDLCLTIIEHQIKDTHNHCQYPLYIKGLILRKKGQLKDSLSYFQQINNFNPSSISNMKEMAKSYYLLGSHQLALNYYNKLSSITEDWEVEYSKALCLLHLNQYDEAIEAFLLANAIQRQDQTFIQLGILYTFLSQYE